MQSRTRFTGRKFEMWMSRFTGQGPSPTKLDAIQHERERMTTMEKLLGQYLKAGDIPL